MVCVFFLFGWQVGIVWQVVVVLVVWGEVVYGLGGVVFGVGDEVCLWWVVFVKCGNQVLWFDWCVVVVCGFVVVYYGFVGLVCYLWVQEGQ